MATVPLVTKVWIAPGCIVCDACETTCPDVFDVTEDTCLIRPEAMDAEFTKPRTQDIIDAAEECPVDVIKYETVEVEGEAPWAGQEEEAETAGAAAGGGGGAKKGGGGAGWERPEGPPDPTWAGLLATSHTSGSRSSGGPAVRVRTSTLPAKAPVEAVAATVPKAAPPDALNATMIGAGVTRPKGGPVEAIKKRGEGISRRAAMALGGVSAALIAGWGALGFTGATVLAALQAFIVPKVTKEPPSIFRAGRLSDFAEPGVYEQHKGSQNVWIVNLGGEVVALSTICTHLGCVVPWNAGENMFKCPCHGSQYAPNGKVTRGPAPRSLELVSATVDGENLRFSAWEGEDFRDA